MIKTYQFNTGVRPFDFDPPAAMALMNGFVDSGNGVYVIPFRCEEVPDNYKFILACDSMDYPKDASPLDGKDYLIRRIRPGSAMQAKYAYFIKTN